MSLYASKWNYIGSQLFIEIASMKDDSQCIFAIRNNEGQCLNKEFDLEDEPAPSNRDDKFLERCRFDNFGKAFKAIKIYEENEKLMFEDQ